MLTDHQLTKLCKSMNVPLAKDGIRFKTEFKPSSLEYNKSYIVNLDDEYDDEGNLKSGTHWTCFQINKCPNGTIEPIYFDPFGIGPPEELKENIMKLCKKKIPFTTKNVQSMMSNACGFYCCAFLHYINNFSHRTNDIYEDTECFMHYFDDLNQSTDFLKNEFILKQFFQMQDPATRKDISSLVDTGTITNDLNGEGLVIPFET